MDAGQILERAFALYRANAQLFLGTLAVLLIPQAILDLIFQPFSVLGIFTNTFSLAALIIAVAARDQGRNMSIGDAYASVGVSTFITLLLTNILAGIIIFIGFILLVIPGIYLLVRFAFVDPVVVLERRGITEALSRSGELVRGSWWRVFGIGLLVFVLIAIADGVLGGILGAALSPRLANAVGVVISIAVQPFAIAALVLLYFDLRIRHQEAVGTMETPLTTG